MALVVATSVDVSPAALAGWVGAGCTPQDPPSMVISQPSGVASAAAAPDPLGPAPDLLPEERDRIAKCEEAIRHPERVNVPPAAVRWMSAICRMATDCDGGSAAFREVLLEERAQRSLPGTPSVDDLVRSQANDTCASASARDDLDFVVRATREVLVAVTADHGAACKQRGKRLLARAKKLGTLPESTASKIHDALLRAGECAGRAGDCETGLLLVEESFALDHGRKVPEWMRKSWPETTKQRCH